MAHSGDIADLQWSFVGDLDSNYFGVTILDSADTTLVVNGAQGGDISVTLDEVVFPPAQLSVNTDAPAPPTIAFVADNNGSIVPTGGGGGVTTIEVVERWY